jgi:hypothetical protein
VATLRYDVDVDDRRAEARIGAFALNMRRQITDAVRNLPDIEIDTNSTQVQRDLAEVRRELVALGEKRVGIDITAEAANAKLDELKARLQALQHTGDIQVDADVESALRDLGIVDAAAEELDHKKVTVKVDVDKSFSDTLIKIAQLGRALGMIALPVAALNIIPQAAAIATSIADLAGVAGLLPAVMLAGGAAFATAKIGLSGFGQALKDIGDPKKFSADLQTLAPAARAVALEVRDLGPAWKSVQLDVQQRLFAGLRDEIKGLAAAELPNLKSGLGGIATELNLSARGFLDWLKSAEQTRDIRTIFDATKTSVANLNPVVTNLSAAFLDVGVVGSRFLPQLANGIDTASAKFRVFIENARETGQLQQWIQTGIEKFDQLGRVVVNIGGSLSAFFSAAGKGGRDFLDTAELITGELNKFLHTDTAQMGIIAVFGQMNAAVDNLLPGLRVLAAAIANALREAANTNGLSQMGQAITDILRAVAPLLPALGQLAGQTLHGLAMEAQVAAAVMAPIVQVLIGILNAAGPVGPAVLGMVLAFRLLSPINALVTSVGASVAGLATRMGAGEAATSRISAAFSKVGTAIPLLGAAIIGLGILYDALRDKTQETATAVLKGSQDFAQAVNQMAASAKAAQDAVAAETATVGRVAVSHKEAADATRNLKTETQLHQEAVAKLVGEMQRQVDGMQGVEKAQGQVKIAQVLWNDAVFQFGPASAEAANAAANLQGATATLEAEQKRAADAAKSLADRITEASQAASAAANADVAYQQAVLNVASANENAAKVAANRASTERDLTAANLQVMQANLQAADAARRKAEADATAAGASNVAQIGAQAYKEELIRLADQATGKTRQALLDMANGTDTAGRAANTAEIAARAQKDELGRLADMSNGPLRAAIAGSIANFNNLGGAHASAEAKAAAQKAELLRLADMASGPVRQSLLDMANQVKSLPNGSFTVTATGVSAYKFTSTGEVLGSGNTGLARGGVWGGPGSHRYMADSGVMPGNTPGRDVHHFFSPTAGGLHLSGGEAVMRPEWTAAISGIYGRKYISEANSAARRGGVRGVMSFLTSTAPNAAGGQAPKGRTRKFADGGIIGDQHLALGGWINAGKPFNQLVPEVFRTDAAEVRRVLIGEVQAKLRAHEAAAKAAIARAAAAAAAALGGGGGAAVAGGPVWDVIQRTAAQFGWGGGAEYAALQWIIMHESGGRPNAQNPTSTAYGLFQFLNGTWASTGIAKTSDPALQALAGMRYIASRYHDPIGAQRFWQAHGWYNQGGVLPMTLADSGAMLPHGTAAVNLSGKMEQVLSPQATHAYNSSDGSSAVVAELTALRGEVRSLQAGFAGDGDTFNIYADNAQEGAHASRMLLRSLR